MPRWLVLFCLTCFLTARPLAAADSNTAAVYKVGLAYRSFEVNKPYDWRGAKSHTLSVAIWYPAAASAIEQPQWIGPPNKPMFAAGRAAPNATPATSPARFPLILLSHGTGGAALQMAWLGTLFAAHGYIAVAVNHPGNNAMEGYSARGFSTWWERARDLSTVTDSMLEDPQFRGRIDSTRIGAAGFSLGGYTMIEIAGGITDPEVFTRFCQSAAADGICKSPPEFPTLSEDFQKLSQTDADFQTALRHAGDSYRDPRVRAVFAIAPALGPAFPGSGLRTISVPVHIVAGSADTTVPIASSARYFAAHIPSAKLTLLPGVGHYTFLDTCTEDGRHELQLLCEDGRGVNRDSVHVRTADLALEFFGRTLHDPAQTERTPGRMIAPRS